MTQVVVAFGSNVGDRLSLIRRAAEGVKLGVVDLKLSPIYESDPLYLTDQPPFLNCVGSGTTALGPFALLELAKDLERKLGRVEREPNGPREIDIDLIAYGSLMLESARLVLPHRGFTKRQFVLTPLFDIEPGIVIPSYGRIGEYMTDAEVASQRLRRLADAKL